MDVQILMMGGSMSEIRNLREGWLNEATVLLNDRVFRQTEVCLPEKVDPAEKKTKKRKVGGVVSPVLFPELVRLSCSWIKGRKTERAVGVCFPQTLSAGGVNEIFITPTVAESHEVLAILVHELIHAMDNNKSRHRGFFKAVSEAVGLEGRRTATTAGDELGAVLSGIVSELGDYPHAEVSLHKRLSDPKEDPKGGGSGGSDGEDVPSDGGKKQKNRQLKVACTCGCIGRFSAKWIRDVDWSTAQCVSCHEVGSFVPDVPEKESEDED